MKTKRESVKSAAKSAATAPKVVAALMLNLKGVFENHLWEGAPLTVAAIPTSNLIAWDEVSMVSDGAKRGSPVMILAANGNYASGHELTEGGFHVTLMAGVSADGTPQPGFLVYSGMDWCTAQGRLRGVNSSWTATWSKTGSMLKNKNAELLTKIAVQILDPRALASEAPVEEAAAEVIEAPPPRTVSKRVTGKRSIAARDVAESAASAAAAEAAAATKALVSELVPPPLSPLMTALDAVQPTEEDLERRIANLKKRASESNANALQLLNCDNFEQAKVHASDANAQLVTQRELEKQLAALRSGLGVAESKAASKVRKAARRQQEEERGVMYVWALHVIKNRMLNQTKGDIIHLMDQHASVRFVVAQSCAAPSRLRAPAPAPFLRLRLCEAAPLPRRSAD